MDRRVKEIYEDDLIDWFKLCPNEDVEKLEVWHDKMRGNFILSAVIKNIKEDEPYYGLKIVLSERK